MSLPASLDRPQSPVCADGRTCVDDRSICEAEGLRVQLVQSTEGF